MFTEVTRRQEIAIIEALAREIWTEHYTPIIGRDQVNYMLCTFQSKDAISTQMDTEGYRYFLMEEEGAHIGYMAVQSSGDELFLSKIYIKASERGKGLGKKAIRFLENLASGLHLRKHFSYREQKQ